MIYHMLWKKLITLIAVLIDWETSGEYALTIFNIIGQYLLELFSKPTPDPTFVEADFALPIEFSSAVNIHLGTVSTGAPSATCSVQAVSL